MVERAVTFCMMSGQHFLSVVQLSERENTTGGQLQAIVQ